MNRRKDNVEKATGSVKAATGLAGGALAGPAGTAAATVFNTVGEEVLSRALAARERKRAEFVLSAAREFVQRRSDAGDPIRRDEFFEPPRELAERLSAPWGVTQPPSHEVLEAAMQSAGRTNEERKLELIAAIYASLLFEPDVKPAQAHLLLRLADRLSYRQLLCLMIFDSPGRPDGFELHSVQPDAPSGLGIEIEELASSGLLGTHNPGDVADPTSSLLEVGLGFIGTTRQGHTLCELMRPATPRSEDLGELVAELISSTARGQ